jgi:hypothetical protein
MNANYAYQQGLLEGAGLTQNQPKRKFSPVKSEQDFRKKGYKKFNPTANIAEDLSEGEESETITNDDDDIVQPSNDKSITGHNTLGTIYTSQEVVDPFGQRILSPKRENLDHHDLLWPVDPTWSRSIIPMETDRSWRSHDDIDLSQYHQSSSITSEDKHKNTPLHINNNAVITTATLNPRDNLYHMDNIDDLAKYKSNIDKDEISKLNNTLNTLSDVYKATIYMLDPLEVLHVRFGHASEKTIKKLVKKQYRKSWNPLYL